MPNHFHGLMMPEADGALSGLLQWVQSQYAADLRARTQTTGYGHVFQRRFWNDDIKDAQHFFSVLRYLEANPLRARLVRRAEEWMWSSLALRDVDNLSLFDPLPYDLPRDWADIVNGQQPQTELDAIRCTKKRGRPSPPKIT